MLTNSLKYEKLNYTARTLFENAPVEIQQANKNNNTGRTGNIYLCSEWNRNTYRSPQPQKNKIGKNSWYSFLLNKRYKAKRAVNINI